MLLRRIWTLSGDSTWRPQAICRRPGWRWRMRVISGILSSKGALGWSFIWTISVIGWDMVGGRWDWCYGEGVCERLVGGDAVGDRM